MDVDSILTDLGARADSDGIDGLTPEERIVLVPWTARGIIGNGGFQLFYQGGGISMHETILAFRALGFEAIADACQTSLSAFPNGRVPTDEDSWEAVKRVDWEKYRDMESVVYDLSWSDLKTAIQKYMF